MFDWMLPENHAIAILKRDHDTVKGLFDEFANSETPARKSDLIDQAVTALKIHALIEEDVFYPAVRAHVGKKIMNEADEEHHVAKVLIAELDHSGTSNDHRDAKFTVLAESVRHHIKEEENQMLPKAKELDLDFEALGQKMLDRKDELERNGIPADAEHAMVAKANGHDNSSVAASRRHKTPTAKKAAAKVSANRQRTSRSHARKATAKAAVSRQRTHDSHARKDPAKGSAPRQQAHRSQASRGRGR